MAAARGKAVRRPPSRALLALALGACVLVGLRSWAHTSAARAAAASPALVLLPPVPPVRSVQIRAELPQLWAEERFESGVEVGVHQGGWSGWVLSRWASCASYTLVDPWAHQQHYADGANHEQAQQEANMALALARTAPYGRKVRVLRNASLDAAAQFADGSVDVVYIDARHDYTSVSADLRAWWRVVRPGGLLCGHDYVDAAEEHEWRTCTGLFGSHPLFAPDCTPCGGGAPGGHGCAADWSVQPDGSRERRARAVKSAVDEFAAARSVQPQVTYKDEASSFFWESWVLRKPPSLAVSGHLATALGGAADAPRRAAMPRALPLPTFRSRAELLTATLPRLRLRRGLELGQPLLDELALPGPWAGCESYVAVRQRPAGGAAGAAGADGGAAGAADGGGERGGGGGGWRAWLRGAASASAPAGRARARTRVVDDLRRAHERVPNASLDFVWLGLSVGFSHGALGDAMRAWWPKLARGGVLAGPAYVEVRELEERANCSGLVESTLRWRRLCTRVCTAPVRTPRDALELAARADSDARRCLPDLRTQPDGSLEPARGLRSAVDAFARQHSRQVQLGYRETGLPAALPLFFTTWALRA